MGNIIRRSAKGRSECANYTIADGFVLFASKIWVDDLSSQRKGQIKIQAIDLDCIASHETKNKPSFPIDVTLKPRMKYAKAMLVKCCILKIRSLKAQN